uniref:Putative salivary kunitz domain protein n=1 Tax=Ixodes ricinus TaxID=34613 RepID=A0A0K8RCC1_IXORI
MAFCLTIVILGLFLAAITAAQQDSNFGGNSDLRVTGETRLGRRLWTLYTCIEYSYACNCYKFKRDGTACRLPRHRYGACQDGSCVPRWDFTTTEEPSTPTTQTDPTTKTN